MKRPQPWQTLKYLSYLLGTALLAGCLLSIALAQAPDAGMSGAAWANPSAMAVKRVGPLGSFQSQPNFLSNLDCRLVDYHLAASETMQTGCFTPTALGLLDSDSDTVIFNGTDEGVRLQPYLANQVLAPWPEALDLIVLDAASTGGSYISLYKNPLASLQDQHNPLLQLTAKQLTAPADLVLKDSEGKPLVINPQTMAFSDNGSWLVVETLGGSFVRINLATLDMVAFAPAFGSQGSPALFQSQVAVSSGGRYVAIGNDAASSLKVYDLASCSGTAGNLQPQNCTSYDYLPFVRQQIGGLQAARHLRFVNDGLLSLEARSSNPANSGTYELAPTDSIKSLIDYLALGDSYTSGEGAFDYLSGTDTDDDMCHLSVDSYPLLLTHDLFSATGGHSVACSGAVINDVGSTSLNYQGQVRGVASLEQLQSGQSALLNSIMANYLPGYVAQQRFVGQYQPAVITVSVGGDDIGFGDILQNCVEPHLSLHLSGGTCYSTYEDRLELTSLIDRTVPRWTALYKQLLAEAPGTKVYAIGYPQVVADTGNCALNVHLDKSELEFAEELIGYLNSSIRQASVEAGVNYVDISQALAGHRLCETASYNVAVNGLTAGTDGKVLGIRVFGKESYHPNALGQALIEQAILKQTNNLGSGTVGVAGSDGQDILTAPKTGRTTNDLIPDENLTTGLVQPGASMAVKANGLQDGLKPGNVYTIRLDGANGLVLGAAVGDSTGSIAGNITLPTDTTPGGHTIDVTGQNQAGQPVDVTQPIYVPASDNDADGDGILDVLDTCPGVINSGQDSDHDGIDDVCDGFIGSTQDNGDPGGTNGPGGGTDSQSDAAGGAGAAAGTIGTSSADKDLGDWTSTIVTNFTLTKSTAAVLGAQVLANKTINNGVGPTRLLGNVTTNPANVGDNSFKPPTKPGQANFPRLLNKLPVINWLPWAALPVIVWLIVLMALSALRKHTKTRGFQLQ